MGKKRRNRSKREAMELEEIGKTKKTEPGDETMGGESVSGFGRVEEGDAALPPRQKKATVRRNISIRKKVMLEKALNRVEKASMKTQKQRNKNEFKSVLKKMY
mmetsp:Transcript_32730/g.45424  ORF Transcript_32730/g.45424 Transcript_32730/m.45424 type:complete len:103 (-) Transcript_32730:222-530(-)|eukprot:CAMPEP_0196585590 /NCGR_PEP_ID=MMETSP1081-20130531/51252_1 /TAXON_ID=36882 /ORGANISM="Pyramimonas amylifera, Strain CCMP720" /LENGTH=102 /DNA_ID=CAMNT_0041907189 /DNA_START=225 /DNA_END=533 /DNA_ORIENTATION=-